MELKVGIVLHGFPKFTVAFSTTTNTRQGLKHVNIRKAKYGETKNETGQYSD